MFHLLPDHFRKRFTSGRAGLRLIMRGLQPLPARAKNGGARLGRRHDKRDARLVGAFALLSLVTALYCFKPLTQLHLTADVSMPKSHDGAVAEMAAAATTAYPPPQWSARTLLGQLKELGLWEMAGSAGVPPALFASFPADINQLDIALRKKVFLRTLLPVTLVALAEVEREREALVAVLARLDNREVEFSPALGANGWQQALNGKERAFIKRLTRKYRTTKASELLARVNVLPPSLILAQGAYESSWGGSRFARLGNNLFGMWTWGEKGIVPARREPGKTHKLAVYESLLEAVRHYLLTINRVGAYEDLWEIRQRTMDPLAIAEGLYYYSERGNAYISEVKGVIRRNGLAGYDKYHLDQRGFNDEELPAI